jgi:hypothetical protein
MTDRHIRILLGAHNRDPLTVDDVYKVANKEHWTGCSEGCRTPFMPYWTPRACVNELVDRGYLHLHTDWVDKYDYTDSRLNLFLTEKGYLILKMLRKNGRHQK